jgi:hypothetical protein
MPVAEPTCRWLSDRAGKARGLQFLCHLAKSATECDTISTGKKAAGGIAVFAGWPSRLFQAIWQNLRQSSIQYRQAIKLPVVAPSSRLSPLRFGKQSGKICDNV